VRTWATDVYGNRAKWTERIIGAEIDVAIAAINKNASRSMDNESRRRGRTFMHIVVRFYNPSAVWTHAIFIENTIAKSINKELRSAIRFIQRQSVPRVSCSIRMKFKYLLIGSPATSLSLTGSTNCFHLRLSIITEIYGPRINIFVTKTDLKQKLLSSNLWMNFEIFPVCSCAVN